MAMTALFTTLATALGAIAAYAFASGTSAAHILIGASAAAVAFWLASLARAAWSRRRNRS